MGEAKVLTVKLAAPDLRFVVCKTGYEYYPAGSGIDITYQVKNVGNLGVRGANSSLEFYSGETEDVYLDAEHKVLLYKAGAFISGFGIPFDYLDPGKTSEVFSRVTGVTMPYKADFKIRVELKP